MRPLTLLLATALTACGGQSGIGAVDSPSASGSNCLIPTSQLVNGGPGRDGIPALNRPAVVPASGADAFLSADALVLGVSIAGQSRAYPHNVLWWHEIVNDELGGRSIVVSYCPLTGSGMVYDPEFGGQVLNFGVSGLLFDNNLVLFDRATESLWSQMRPQAVCGSLAGTTPTLLPVVQSTWQAWRALHPETTVVSFSTGFNRNYDQYPYGSYDQVGNESLLFPQSPVDPRRPAKELALGLKSGSVARAYPHGSLGERSAVNDSVGGRSVLVVFDASSEMALAFSREVSGRPLTFFVADARGFPFQLRDDQTGSLWDLTGRAVEGPLTGSQLEPIATFSAMWFAWAAFNPDTELYTP